LNEVELERIQSLEDVPLDEEVKIAGMVTKLTKKDKVVFLTVEGLKTETMDIIFFPKEDIFINLGDHVTVEGTVEEYQGKKEVVGNKLVVR